MFVLLSLNKVSSFSSWWIDFVCALFCCCSFEEREKEKENWRMNESTTLELLEQMLQGPFYFIFFVEILKVQNGCWVCVDTYSRWGLKTSSVMTDERMMMRVPSYTIQNKNCTDTHTDSLLLCFPSVAASDRHNNSNSNSSSRSNEKD